MLEDYQEQQQRKAIRLRAGMDYTMGFFLIIIGTCFLLYNQLRLQKIFNRPHTELDYVIAGMFILYGIWRIYRGYKKNYYR